MKKHSALSILNSQPDYREKLNEELRQLRESEMWQTGAVVRVSASGKQLIWLLNLKGRGSPSREEKPEAWKGLLILFPFFGREADRHQAVSRCC